MVKDYLDRVKQVVLDELAEESVAIALFGSVAIESDTYASDVDVAIVPKGVISYSKLSQLREKIEDIAVPYVVDIVDFSMVSESFKNNALLHAVWWRT